MIDLGSSCFITDHLSSYVQSRSYRAPEVILGLPYGQKIDIWSLGCILAELATGYVLFQVCRSHLLLLAMRLPSPTQHPHVCRGGAVSSLLVGNWSIGKHAKAKAVEKRAAHCFVQYSCFVLSFSDSVYLCKHLHGYRGSCGA